MTVDLTRLPTWLASLDPQESTCPDCGATILWGTTRAGKSVPIDLGDHEIEAEVYMSHYATCPNVKET